MIEQKLDTSLTDASDKAIPYRGISEKLYCFYIKDELLYRKWQLNSRRDMVQHQIVVLMKYQEMILKLSHQVPLTGRISIAKTKAKILQLHYWPIIVKDIKRWCQSIQIIKSLLENLRLIEES